MSSIKDFDKNEKSKRKIIRKWFADNFIIVWIIISALFALIVHCLFSISAPNEWFEAKWGAGDILTFVSTVSLGLLAVWQNKRFKEENDEAQLRMEKLIKESNDLTFINKIIEYETNSINKLLKKKEAFIAACDTESATNDISDVAQQPHDFMKTYVKIKMDNRITKIKFTAIDLLSELSIYPEKNSTTEKVKDMLLDYSEHSQKLMKSIRDSSSIENEFRIKKSKEKEFITEISSFILKKEIILNKIIYGKLSFDEINKLYRDNL